jgi:hypothetical protein
LVYKVYSFIKQFTVIATVVLTIEATGTSAQQQALQKQGQQQVLHATTVHRMTSFSTAEVIQTTTYTAGSIPNRRVPTMKNMWEASDLHRKEKFNRLRLKGQSHVQQTYTKLKRRGEREDKTLISKHDYKN